MIEGYPDLSADHASDVIGILSYWRLKLVAAPEMEGRREHLESLIEVVFPYARHRLSGVDRSFGGADSYVSIEPENTQHALHLRSSGGQLGF